MAKKKKTPLPARSKSAPPTLTSRQRTELEHEWASLRGDTSEAATRRRLEIEEQVQRGSEWVNPLHRDNVMEVPSQRVRAIELALMQLTVEEQRLLCSRFHNYIHPAWVIQERAEWEKDQRALRHMTNTVMYETTKPKKPKKDAERTADIIKLSNGGPKAEDGRSAEQVRKKLKQKYPGLTRGAINQVIRRHEAEQAKRRDFGL